MRLALRQVIGISAGAAVGGTLAVSVHRHLSLGHLISDFGQRLLGGALFVAAIFLYWRWRDRTRTGTTPQ